MLGGIAGGIIGVVVEVGHLMAQRVPPEGTASDRGGSDAAPCLGDRRARRAVLPTECRAGATQHADRRREVSAVEGNKGRSSRRR